MASSSAGSSSNELTTRCQKKARDKCSFVGCGRSQLTNPDLHFFRFPIKRPQILEQWLINCGNENLIGLTDNVLYGKRVCSKHFYPECFTNNMRRFLTKEAVPSILDCDLDDGETATTVEDDKTDDTVETVFLGKQSPTHDQDSSLHFSQPSPKTPSTPTYKKFRSIINRTPTPRRKKLTPMKSKLIKQLKDTRKHCKKFQTRAKRLTMRKRDITKDELISALKDYLPPAVSNFVTMQINHTNAPKKTWSQDERHIALRMSYKSPRFYNEMRKDGFALPSKSTIGRWLQEIDLKPGICQDLIKSMKAKVDCMSEWEKKSVILFDEMQIKIGLEYDCKRDVVEGIQDLGELGRTKVPGDKVLLFLVRGLVHRWKMPFAYFIVNDSINSKSVRDMLKMCVETLMGIGLDIKCVVCDQSTTNRGAAKSIGVTLKTPFFKMQERKIYWIYDFPHIIKCIRNNLMKKSKKTGEYVGAIESCDGVARWTHINDLYLIDKSSVTARATKLTDKHLNPNSFEKMSVKLSTQVLSHTVSTAMTTAVETRQLPPEAKETAAFIQRMNDIFDAMNSKSKFSPNPYRCAISNAKDPHSAKSLEVIKKGVEWARTLKMNATKKRPPSFEGMEHTLTATIKLWEDVHAEGVGYLLTGRVNQDPLENEFSIARLRGGYNRNPTAKQFRQNLRHRITCALLQPPSGSNCEPDEDELLEVTSEPNLTQTNEPRDGASNELPEVEELQTPFCNSDDSDCETMDIAAETGNSLEACAVRYFAGYAVRACLKKFKCTTCLEELIQAPASDDEALIRNRQYIDASGQSSDALVYPSQMTVETAKSTLEITEKMLNKSIHSINIRKDILSRCKQTTYKSHREWMKCGEECYTHRIFVLNKLITAKIHRKLQQLSKEMRQPGGKYGGFFQKTKILQGQ